MNKNILLEIKYPLVLLNMVELIQEIVYQEVQRLLKENMAQQRKDRSLMAESSEHTRGWGMKWELPEPKKSEESQRELEEY